MSFLRGLLTARSHLALMLGLVAALAVVRLTSHPAAAARGSPTEDLMALAPLARDWPLRRPAPLSRSEREMAEAAWSYFDANSDAHTGLAHSVKGYPSTTMWDLGSQLMAVLAAEQLGLASRAEARRRLERALSSLVAMPLGARRLPNKAYDTRTLHMVDYDNRPEPQGIGWSALDVGRLLVPLEVIVHRMPELTPLVERAVARFDLEALGDGGALRGGRRLGDGRIETYQEGRLGYEQYAARALLAWGVPVAAALDLRHATLVDVGGQLVPVDDRRPRDHGGARAPSLSEPWLLHGLEHGFDATTLPLARAVLAAQAARWAATGRLTAVSEDHLDHAPGFAYSAIVDDGATWTATSPDGRAAPADLTFSAKAAVGWAALFEGRYPDRLLAACADLVEPGAGVYAGRYDATGEVNRVLSLNTNAVVLEALAYRTQGRPLGRGGPLASAEVRR